MVRWLWLSIIVVIVDQITKYFALAQLSGPRSIEVFPFFSFTLVFNTGAAFGVLNDAGGWQNMFFITLASIVSIVFLVMIVRLKPAELQLAVAFSLVLGGAAGNLIDRFMHGYVIDFLDFYYGTWHFPTFNIADSAISIGAVFLISDAFGFKLISPKMDQIKF